MRAEGENHLSQPAGHSSFDIGQLTGAFLGCECTLPRKQTVCWTVSKLIFYATKNNMKCGLKVRPKLT